MILTPRSWLLLLAAILISACAAPTNTQVLLEGGVRPLQAGHEAVVLFPIYRERTDAGNADFIGCLKKNLEKQVSARVKIMDSAAFQDALFPWFEAQCAPSSIEELNALLARSLVSERIASLGVRYLVNIASTADSHGFPGMFCGAGYGGGGCLGISWEDKTYRVQAVIWDVVKGVESGTLSTTTSGRSFGFAFGIPIIFVAYTEKDACEALSAELGRLLIETSETGTISK
jgi:hypothetical protein